MKQIFGILIIIFCIVAAAFAQPAHFEKVKTITGSYASFSIDNMSNIYLLSATNQLKKLNAGGDSVAVFNDVKKFGQARLVDVSNPVKILLFYKDFITIAILDGMLNLKNTIDLRRTGFYNVSAVGLAYDGKIWVYDEIENCLKKIEDNGNVLLKTPDFRQLFDPAPVPQYIYDANHYVYLYDPLQGLYTFDYYGAFKNKMQIRGWNNIAIGEKSIFGTDSLRLYQYSPGSFASNDFLFPAEMKNAKQYFFTGTHLYILKEASLEVYDYR